jgi:hypothetical protein
MQWSSLPLRDRISAAEVRQFHPAWPDGRCIEIRECKECAHGIPEAVACSNG